jgi:hypothetical protein
MHEGATLRAVEMGDRLVGVDRGFPRARALPDALPSGVLSWHGDIEHLLQTAGHQEGFLSDW